MIIMCTNIERVTKKKKNEPTNTKLQLKLITKMAPKTVSL